MKYSLHRFCIAISDAIHDSLMTQILIYVLNKNILFLNKKIAIKAWFIKCNTKKCQKCKWLLF